MSTMQIVEFVGIPAFVLIAAIGAAILAPSLWELLFGDGEPTSMNPANNAGGVAVPVSAPKYPAAVFEKRSLHRDPQYADLREGGMHRASKAGLL